MLCPLPIAQALRPNGAATSSTTHALVDEDMLGLPRVLTFEEGMCFDNSGDGAAACSSPPICRRIGKTPVGSGQQLGSRRMSATPTKSWQLHDALKVGL